MLEPLFLLSLSLRSRWLARSCVCGGRLSLFFLFYPTSMGDSVFALGVMGRKCVSSVATLLPDFLFTSKRGALLSLLLIASSSPC
jgi:hypothetical protein